MKTVIVEAKCLEVDQCEVAIKSGLAERADELFAMGFAWMAESKRFKSKGLNCQAWIVGDYEIPEVALFDNFSIGFRDF
ncbi:hypothetical protein A7X89_09060 [Stenotrophomonas maltophilia]|uniref:hypothetical protein n=1 Tax=Stenotrophomonas hibiscicola TaxID=86189 RepID=UPI000DA8FB6B|nr:hypothetical protein A7X89_09060 [Stenotrophomonas maltophilia]